MLRSPSIDYEIESRKALAS